MSYAIDLVLPPRCAVTGDIVAGQGTVSPRAWSQLDFIIAPLCACCGVPFGFDVESEGMTCASCLAEPPVFETARAALVYNDKSRDLILRFKHADQIHTVRAFAPWLVRAGGEMLERGDVLIPVPLHYRRLVQRRYNQAALLAQAVGRVTGKPVLLESLQRTRATPPQGHRKARDRHKNVKKAFAVHAPDIQKISGKNIVLIDDVYTTGATLSECTRALLEAGAARVDCLTLARVVRPV